MPYTGPNDSDLPGWVKSLPNARRRGWVSTFNDEYDTCIADGGGARKCEQEATRLASAAVNEHDSPTAGGSLSEAATLKTRAQRLMRDMTAILALRDVPAAVRKEIEDVRAIFKRTWADLADAAGEESTMELGDIARVLGDGRTLAEVLAEVTKTVDGVQYPASAFLVVGDPDAVSTWALRVRDEEGNIDRRLLGAAWAALHGGYRGNVYEGPDKEAATRKLTALYRSENMPTPNTRETARENGYENEASMLDIWSGARSFADLRSRREAEDMASIAEQLFYDFGVLVRSTWYAEDVSDKGAAILELARELAGELRNLQNLAAETDTAAEDDAGHSDAEPEQGDAIGGDSASTGTDAEPAGETGDESGEEDDMAGQVVEEVQANTEIKEDTIDKETEQLCESSDGAEVLSLGALAEAETGGPLTVKVKLIRPGAGNKADRHYYPAPMLKRDARRFAGAKMYETDHRSEEKSTRTWVSTIRDVSEFDADGSPVAEVVVHDPGFAERLRNLNAAAMLGRMECSILASGRVKEGQVDGQDYRIVEAIEDVQSVDWVTRAGAGGQAVALAESEEGMTVNDKPGEGEQPVAESVEIVEPQPEPVVMSREQVNAWLEEHANLPTPVLVLLAERAYTDEHEIEAAVTEMGTALAQEFGAGRVTDNTAAKPQPKASPREMRESYYAGVDNVNKKRFGR